jgi:hypothetical protein
VLQLCQYSFNISERRRALRQWLRSGEAFILATALSFD